MTCSPEYLSEDQKENSNTQKLDESTKRYLLDAVIDARDKSENLEQQLLSQKDQKVFWEKKAISLELKEIEARNEMVRWRDLESVARNRARIAEKKIVELEKESEDRFNQKNREDMALSYMSHMHKLLNRMKLNIEKQQEKNEYYSNMAHTLAIGQDQTDEWNIYQGQMIERLQKELAEKENVNRVLEKKLERAEAKILELEKVQNLDKAQTPNLIYYYLVISILVCVIISLIVGI